MFQGKFGGRLRLLRFRGPYFCDLHNGSFRGDKSKRCDGCVPPLRRLSVDIPDAVVRNKPQEVFRNESRRCFDRGCIIVSGGARIKGA